MQEARFESSCLSRGENWKRFGFSCIFSGKKIIAPAPPPPRQVQMCPYAYDCLRRKNQRSWQASFESTFQPFDYNHKCCTSVESKTLKTKEQFTQAWQEIQLSLIFRFSFQNSSSERKRTKHDHRCQLVTRPKRRRALRSRKASASANTPEVVFIEETIRRRMASD